MKHSSQTPTMAFYVERGARRLSKRSLELIEHKIYHFFSYNQDEKRALFKLLLANKSCRSKYKKTSYTSIAYASEQSYIAQLTIEENILLGQRIHFFSRGKIAKLRCAITRHLKDFGLSQLEPTLKNLGPELSDIISIVKLLVCADSMLIFDNLCTRLSPQNKNIFFNKVAELVQQQKTIVIYSEQYTEHLPYSPDTPYQYLVLHKGIISAHENPSPIEKAALGLILTGKRQLRQSLNISLQQERLKAKNLATFIDKSNQLLSYVYDFECCIIRYTKNSSEEKPLIFATLPAGDPLYTELLDHFSAIESDKVAELVQFKGLHQLTLELDNQAQLSLIFSSPRRSIDLSAELAFEVYTEQLKLFIKELSIQEKLNYTQRLDSLAHIAGGIAHDLNNSLFIISSALVLIQDSTALDEVQQYTDIVAKALQDASELSTKLLSISRKKSSSYGTVNLKQVCSDVVDIFTKSISKNLNITTHYPDKPVLTKGDAHEIKGSLLNILINASQAVSQNGDITISVDVIEHSASNHLLDIEQTLIEGQYCQVNIKDNGCGIDADKIQYVVEPFYTLRQADGGSGLGLSIVHSMIKEHHGHLCIDSSEQQGTSVTLLFPPTSDSPAPAKKLPVASNNATGSLLICDDNIKIRNLLTKLLSKKGFNCSAVESAKECLNLYQRQPEAFDLIILDDIMPEMTGSECFVELKKLDPDVKVFMLSGYRKNHNIDSLYELGLLQFFIKPVDIDKFVEAIKLHI